MRIRLLGAPQIERDGHPVVGPRGHKAWALLAYLLLSRAPSSRQRLSALLFEDAEDPLGVLRWNLAELRRVLGQPGALRGDPVELALGPDTASDVDELLSAKGVLEIAACERLGRELLEGLSFAASPLLDAWLMIERQRLAAAARAHLYERAQIELGAGRPASAAHIAQRLVEAYPFDQEGHELLVRSLVATGDRRAAIARVEACEQLIVRELGVAASRRIRAALPAEELPRPAAISTVASVRAQLETGRASIAAGAVETGLDCLARACAAAPACGDDYLHARAQLALGSALVHARMEHGQGAVALHAAAELAERTGARDIAATALRELGFVDVVAGRRERATALLERAAAAAGDSDEELASIVGLRGVNLSDAARYEEAFECFDESIERATRVGNRRQTAWSSAFLGRAYLLTGRLAAAREALEQSLELGEEENWIAFVPMPEALLAHVDVAEGRVDAARAALEHAYTLACQVADPCWEAVACRGFGILEANANRRAQALTWLDDSLSRCTRVANPYQWVHGWILDAACDIADNDERVGRWIEELESLAARMGMRELVVRAYVHRGRRGDPAAAQAARSLAADIANPALRL